MMQFEKPDGPEDWLARIAVALLITTIVSLVIVVGFLWLSIDSPTWTLPVAVAVIFALMLAIVFSPTSDEPEDQVEDNLRWKKVERPTSVKGWAKRAGLILLTWWGMGIIVNALVLELVFDASDAAKGIAAILLIPLAVLVETFDVVEVQSVEPENRVRNSATTDADVRETSL